MKQTTKKIDKTVITRSYRLSLDCLTKLQNLRNVTNRNHSGVVEQAINEHYHRMAKKYPVLSEAVSGAKEQK